MPYKKGSFCADRQFSGYDLVDSQKHRQIVKLTSKNAKMTSSPREAELRSPSSSTDCSDDSPSRGIQVSEALVLSCDLDTNSRITKLFKRQQSTMHLQTSRYALEEEAMVPLAENLLPYAPPVQSSETLLQLIYRLSGSDHKLLVKLLQNLTKTLLDTYCHYGSLIVLDHCEGRHLSPSLSFL